MPSHTTQSPSFGGAAEKPCGGRPAGPTSSNCHSASVRPPPTLDSFSCQNPLSPWKAQKALVILLDSSVLRNPPIDVMHPNCSPLTFFLEFFTSQHIFHRFPIEVFFPTDWSSLSRTARRLLIQTVALAHVVSPIFPLSIAPHPRAPFIPGRGPSPLPIYISPSPPRFLKSPDYWDASMQVPGSPLSGNGNVLLKQLTDILD